MDSASVPLTNSQSYESGVEFEQPIIRRENGLS